MFGKNPQLRVQFADRDQVIIVNERSFFRSLSHEFDGEGFLSASTQSVEKNLICKKMDHNRGN